MEDQDKASFRKLIEIQNRRKERIKREKEEVQAAKRAARLKAKPDPKADRSRLEGPRREEKNRKDLPARAYEKEERFRLFCPFDARSISDVVEKKSVHLWITSPPYFDVKDYSGGDSPFEEIEGDLGNYENYTEWLDVMQGVWRQLFHLTVPGGRFCCNTMVLPDARGSIPIPHDMIRISLEAGWILRDEIIWVKENQHLLSPNGSWPYPTGMMLNNHHEHIAVFQRPGKRDSSHLTPEIKEASRLDGLAFNKYPPANNKNWRRDIWEFPAESDRSHSAPFPVELPLRLIYLYSFMGELVGDPFTGSGTTAYAARVLGRRFVGVELNHHFKDMIENKGRMNDISLDSYLKSGVIKIDQEEIDRDKDRREKALKAKSLDSFSHGYVPVYVEIDCPQCGEREGVVKGRYEYSCNLCQFTFPFIEEKVDSFFSEGGVETVGYSSGREEEE